jgi:hypothetical protein
LGVRNIWVASFGTDSLTLVDPAALLSLGGR